MLCMLKRGKLVFCLLWLTSMLSLKAVAQVGSSPFTFQNPAPFGFTLQDVHFSDNNNGLAVGYFGGIAKTTDAGKTWTYGTYLFANKAGIRLKPTINDVHFVTPSIAYAAGTAGMFAKSVDGGITWTQMVTPFYDGARDINAIWFTDANTGYIGGVSVSGSGAPKLYVTKDGGASWDSLNAPIGARTRIGYINNATRPPQLAEIRSEGKEIKRIVFSSKNVGYVSGSGSGSAPFTNINGTNSNSFSVSAGMLWKFENGTLTDYSLGKDKFGYTGIPTSTISATTQFNAPTICQQTYPAMAAVSDTMVILASQNNLCVVRVSTGKNDETNSISVPGEKIPGKYEILQYGFPTNQPTPPALPVIAGPNVLPFSNMFQMIKAPDGTIYVTCAGGQLGISKDNGTTWTLQQVLPAAENFGGTLLSAVAATPNGRIIAMGGNGTFADSIPGGKWQTSYRTARAGGSINRMEFIDCNRGVTVGGFGSMFTTTDGGKTWNDKTILSMAAGSISIYGLAWPAPDKLYFVSSDGKAYMSTDQGTTNDLIFTPISSTTNFNIAIQGNRLWIVGHRYGEPTFRSVVYRSLDGGNTWDTTRAPFPTGNTASVFQGMKFANADTGYIGGSRGKFYRTINGGNTWEDVSPFPALNASTSFNAIGIVDAKTVFTGGGVLTKRVYKSTDAGLTWTDITPVIPNEPIGTILDFVFHDANNGYIMSNGGTILVTNDGGTSWKIEHTPTGILVNAGQLLPKAIPAGTRMDQRKLVIGGSGLAGMAIPVVMEYGDAAKYRVNATVTATASASCTNLNGGALSIAASGGITPYTYSLDGITYQNGNTFSGLTRGEKTVFVRDAGCNVFSTKVTINFLDNLALTASNDTAVCAGASFNLAAFSNGTGTSFAWTPAASVTNPTAASTAAAITANTTFRVTATLNGCIRTEEVIVTTRPNPVVNAGADVTILAGDETELSGSSNVSAASISWTPATGLSTPGVYNTWAKPAQTTTYTLTVTDNNKCFGKDDVVVTVLPYCLEVMNAFTPNGDGQNDLWMVTKGTSCVTKVEINVYNRYGQLVFTNRNYTNNWDGKVNGKDLPDGTYYYRNIYTLINGRKAELKGDVTILR